jgi:hypothetical protein
MDFWEDFIAVNESEIARLRDVIGLMEAGTFEMRSLEHGRWVNQNKRWISEDRATIERLEELVHRAKTEKLIFRAWI